MSFSDERKPFFPAMKSMLPLESNYIGAEIGFRTQSRLPIVLPPTRGVMILRGCFL